MDDTTLARPAGAGHGADSVRAHLISACLIATCAGSPGCRRTEPGPDVQIVGESTRVRLEDPVPAHTPWLVDGRVKLVAARGETLGIQVLHRARGAVTLTVTTPGGSGLTVVGYDVDSFAVTRPSTQMYGGGRAGTFADALRPAAPPTTNPAYFELAIDASLAPGTYTGELAIGERRLPVDLEVGAARLPPLVPRVWAYADPRELGSDLAAPSAEEIACATLFATYGVWLTPDLHLDGFAARRGLVAGMHDLPVVIPDDPATVGAVVRGWIEATRGSGVVPFAIPIDEPSTPERRARVIALARAVRAAGGGPTTFRFAVTDDPRPEYGDLVDLYISLHTLRSANGAQWTYNGAPPRAGSMVLDAQTPGPRTWGWIGYRWNIPVWYVWDGLYWHDRHNRKELPLDARALRAERDPTSFDGGEDHGNLDGVLALPAGRACQPTLRLAAIRRGLHDRQLLEAAAACAPAATEAVAARLVPRALGDAPGSGPPSWPTDEGAWELARRELLTLAACK